MPRGRAAPDRRRGSAPRRSGRAAATLLPVRRPLGGADLAVELGELARLASGERQQPRLRLPRAVERKSERLAVRREAGPRCRLSPVVICAARPPLIGHAPEPRPVLAALDRAPPVDELTSRRARPASCVRSVSRRTSFGLNRRGGHGANHGLRPAVAATVLRDPNPFNSVQRGRKGVRCMRTPAPAPEAPAVEPGGRLLREGAPRRRGDPAQPHADRARDRRGEHRPRATSRSSASTRAASRSRSACAA